MTSHLRSVFVHIVTYNSAKYIIRCVDSLLTQEGFAPGKDLILQITDNSSSDGTGKLLREKYGEKIELTELSANIGFCGGHNRGVARFMESGSDYLLIANPDLRLAPDALQFLCSCMDERPLWGWVSPKLLRADAELNPAEPPTIDSAGMILCSSLRHFDRGSGKEDRRQFDRREAVFGASGACMLLRRAFVHDMIIDDAPLTGIPAVIFPALSGGRKERLQLFDEAFFAYREDADLAWRAEGTKWQCGYVPEAVGYHVRVVLPERRNDLDPGLNLHSVRNRFLLQLNNYSFAARPTAFLPGIIVRNIAVILGVMMLEHSSLPAFRQILKLRRRAMLIRKQNKKRRLGLRLGERGDNVASIEQRRGGHPE